MDVSLKSEGAIREYLLGRVSDETTLERLEELLFSDEEFCSQVELVEEDLINDYVMGRLNAADAESFRATLAGNSERRFKLELTQGLKDKALARNPGRAEKKSSFLISLQAFLLKPQYAGALAVLTIAVVGLIIYFSRQPRVDDLAELQSIYRHSRPTESRISNFAYAPLPQLRGAPEAGELRSLRRIENNLIDKTEKDSNARSHHELGTFYLTQRNYSKAIDELGIALRFAEQNAQIHNDLGVAHFELAKTLAHEKKFEELARSLEEFSKATELDGNLLEALFNKSLALQELDVPSKAKESWTRYLEKDPSSPWADEARKNLARIETRQASFKSDEQVLSDFLTAYRNHDDARAQKIHNATKGTLGAVTIPLQLARSYLIATQQSNHEKAKENLEALTYIGNFERAQNGDSFFLELAQFYASAGPEKVAGLLQAQDVLATGHRLVSNGANAISKYEESRDLFMRLGDECEAALAENWAVQFLPDIARVGESQSRLAGVIANAENKKFLVLLPPAYYWLAMGDYKQRRFSDSARNLKMALRLAQTTNNFYKVEATQHALAVNYSELGEIESALAYAGKLLKTSELYYQNPRQDWRNKGVLGDLALKLKLFSTALSFGRERLVMVQTIWPSEHNRINDSLRSLIETGTASQHFSDAMEYASASMQVALTGGNTAENTRKIAEIYLLQADARRDSKNCPEALADYDKALDFYRRYPEVSDTLYQIHRGKLFCFQQLNRNDDFSSELKIVFRLAEAYRATIREDDSRQAFFASEQGVFDAAAANLLAQQDSRRAFALIEASRARSLLDFVASGKSIVEVERNFGPVTRPLKLTEIQARLPEQVQVVQYAVLPEKLAIWIVSKTRFDLLEKQITSTEVEKKIEDYQELLVRGSPALALKGAARDLHQLLIPPDLAADKQLCLVPDKSLHQLAFATLVSPEGKFLLQTHTLFYSPSFSVLVLSTENARQREHRIESLLSVGNPDFDRDENPNLPDLKDAETEARTITADYQKSLELIGSEATKEKFLRSGPAAEVIHFAGHFLANRRSPGNSKLLFANGELRTSELSAYKLPIAKLVVLSACETGFERYNKSEGAIGIARTWLALGTPIVVASQWKVDSEPTKDLMIAFHRNRKEKRMSTAESLRQAQLELLGRDATKAPSYWAAFSLFGGYANY